MDIRPHTRVISDAGFEDNPKAVTEAFRQIFEGFEASCQDNIANLTEAELAAKNLQESFRDAKAVAILAGTPVYTFIIGDPEDIDFAYTQQTGTDGTLFCMAFVFPSATLAESFLNVYGKNYFGEYAKQIRVERLMFSCVSHFLMANHLEELKQAAEDPTQKPSVPVYEFVVDKDDGFEELRVAASYINLTLSYSIELGFNPMMCGVILSASREFQGPEEEG